VTYATNGFQDRRLRPLGHSSSFNRIRLPEPVATAGPRVELSKAAQPAGFAPHFVKRCVYL
jgi:hypothetical protein